MKKTKKNCKKYSCYFCFQILPLAQNADPWGPGATVAMLIMSTPLPPRENQANSLRKLKTLLNGYYGYE